MRKVCFICFLICIILVMTACTTNLFDAENKIVPPDNDAISLLGVWKVGNCLTNSPTGNRWTGKSGEFTTDTVIMGGKHWDNVGYKVKRVSAEEYFLFKYDGSVEDLGISDKDIYTITVSSGNNFLYEFIKLEDDKMIAEIENELYFVERVSEESSREVFVLDAERRNDEIGVDRYEDKFLHSGILLGIRTPEELSASEIGNNELCRYTYRTLWIAADDRNLNSVLEIDNILLPRKSGFWMLVVQEVNGNGIIQDVPMAYSMSQVDFSAPLNIREDIGFWESREGVLRKKILYVGNDFLCVESLGTGIYRYGLDKWDINSLRTIPVDNITNSQGVKISDIAGENGIMAMQNGISGLINTSNSNVVMENVDGNQERSFALFRKTGHWYTKGRLNLNENTQVPFIDFNINLIPPTEMVAYDVFQMSWTYLKDKIPEAVDAYTSPNEDIAIVLTDKELLVYALHEGNLEDIPMHTITLNNGDSVVMAEWATGDYVEKWEKVFNNSKEVKDLNFITSQH